MSKISLRNLIFGILALGLATTAIGGGLGTLLTRNPHEHSGTFHQSGHAVFNAFVAPTIGGVIAQAVVRGVREESDVSLRLTDTVKYDGTIEVTVGGVTGQFEVGYDELVRASLFVDGGRTALYTLWDPGDSRLPDRFAQDAGFMSAMPRGMVAIEFRTVSYSERLHKLDVQLESCLVPIEADPALSDLNEALAAEADNPNFVFDSFDGSYIVSDLARPFRLTVRDGKVILKGGLHRFHWQAARGTTAELIGMTLYDPSACNQIDLAILNDLTSLFGTIALMRTAREHDETAFVTFLESLSAETLIGANPQPWEDYTAAAIELYPHLER